jgi:pyruvate dehydrogenase (quinone)
MGRWRANMMALETPDRAADQPQYVAAVVDRLASDNAILSTDSGTIATWASRHFHIRGDRRFMPQQTLQRWPRSPVYDRGAGCLSETAVHRVRR